MRSYSELHLPFASDSCQKIMLEKFIYIFFDWGIVNLQVFWFCYSIDGYHEPEVEFSTSKNSAILDDQKEIKV